MRSVALLLLGLRLAFAGTHSLQYYYTVVSGEINYPEFTVVGMIDDQQFMYFDSNIKKAVGKTEWIRQNEGADYWDRETQFCIDHYDEYKHEMRNIINLFNHSTSKGVHTLQVMYGCELDDDGNTRGYLEFGYDGEDFISFDKNTLTWTADNPQAVKWDADRAWSENLKAYVKNECIEWLKKYVNYSKDTLERKDASKVSLLQKDSSSPVICHATGFYPNNIIMTWKKNNEDHHEDVEVSSTLPNEDGTFQKSISLSLKSEEWQNNSDVYRCVIQYVGAASASLVRLNDKNIKTNRDMFSDSIIGITAGCLVALSITAAIIGLIVWRKFSHVKSSNSSSGCMKGSAADNVSEQSVEPMLKDSSAS